MEHYSIIIFGGTGDLSRRKLIPALIALADKDPHRHFHVLGIGRKPFDDQQFRKFLLPGAEKHPRVDLHYMAADIEKEDSLLHLKDRMAEIEPGLPAGRIFYLATAYGYFGKIAENIERCCNVRDPFFTRIVAEKPFGSGRESFKKLNAELRARFREEQIFRADHYLAKGTVDNILRTRFSNPLFERVWNSSSIERITVAVHEALGVGSRIAYYDQTGAIKDMVQNHLLQALALVLMRVPEKKDETAFRKAKTEAIRNLRFRGTIRTGQYRGYQDEVRDLNPGSRTETFAELQLHSRDRRWRGTDILLRTGKMLKKREAYIEIMFKKEPCSAYCEFDLPPNKLILHIQPLQNVELTINSTLPGEKVKLTPVKMIYCPTCEFKANTPEGYEIILDECIRGNKRLFMSEEELSAAWRLTDSITAVAEHQMPEIYEAGTDA